ncbi:glycosyltransferase family 4 protein [uncultured Cellulomonas sp.]|uniref:glycosyltransferase family 4 protein n=1 Tax=uncultured Cellulomonas sp. TaxID=189682 RepID=UPI0026150814|nr:glycosyltransferase family 4 protein [uncultured Cellulomonas sp.]
MELGGSQLNAVELAGAVRDRGHEVAVYADEGVLVDELHSRGLRYEPAVRSRMRPGPARAVGLARLARAVRADVVHGYEWPPALEAWAATATAPRTAAVVTVMSMAVAPFLPSSMPLVVGTARIQRAVASTRSGRTDVIEPPVDTVANRSGPYADEFRQTYGLDPGIPTVVVVSRLAPELKLEGILTAVRAVGRLASSRPLRLVIVGDGPARDRVAIAASAANAQSGYRAVVMTGSLSDPRGAYDAADVALGMGGSALRALAFAKPLVVQGEGGFFDVLTEGTVGTFLRDGWYGVGSDTEPAAAEAQFVRALEPLLDDVALRRRLGAYGRALVESRFSLAAAAEQLEGVYREAWAARPTVPRRLADGVTAGAGLVAYKVQRRRQRRSGTVALDDFNARPV